MLPMNVTSTTEIRKGIRLEVFTVGWLIIEAAISIGAGMVAGSILLTAFGIDSLIEMVSGGVLLWRLSLEAGGKADEERAERAEWRAAWVVGIALALLCIYVLISAIYALVTHSKPESSPVGIGMAVAATFVMPWLSFSKRRVANRIGSGALRGDAASSMTCGYMAATVLIGLALNAVLGWWWVESLAALVFLFWLVGETREALEEARGDEEKNEA